jgi:hypothetical protein
MLAAQATDVIATTQWCRACIISEPTPNTHILLYFWSACAFLTFSHDSLKMTLTNAAAPIGTKMSAMVSAGLLIGSAGLITSRENSAEWR